MIFRQFVMQQFSAYPGGQKSMRSAWNALENIRTENEKSSLIKTECFAHVQQAQLFAQIELLKKNNKVKSFIFISSIKVVLSGLQIIWCRRNG